MFGFAKQSGDEIVADSAPGRGTTFTLNLPRVAAPALRVKAVASPMIALEVHGACVLVVEDDPGVGAVMTDTLAALGYTSVLATDGAQALAELAKDARRFNVVFSNVVMPGMNGIERGREVRRRYVDLPVVLTSG